MKVRSKITSAMIGLAAMVAVTLPAVTAASPASATTCGRSSTYPVASHAIVITNCPAYQTVLFQWGPLYAGQIKVWDHDHPNTTVHYSDSRSWDVGDSWTIHVSFAHSCAEMMGYDSVGGWYQFGNIECAFAPGEQPVG